MRIDMHVHCLPVSGCAHHQPEQLPEMYRDSKMDAFVLTNHCYPKHCDRLSSDLAEQAKIFVDTYHRCKDKGDEIGIKVFFGVELKLINEPNKPEFLLYGISEDDFINSYPLYNATQKDVFDFCNQKDIVMVQAHPFRIEQGYSPADMNYLHGIEIFNPHPHFDARFEKALKLADDNGKLKTSGCDFHIKRQAGGAGMVVPDYINDQFMLRDYLRQGKVEIFDRNTVFYKSEQK